MYFRLKLPSSRKRTEIDRQKSEQAAQPEKSGNKAEETAKKAETTPKKRVRRRTEPLSQTKQSEPPPQTKQTTPPKEDPHTYGILVVDDDQTWKNLYELNLFKHVSKKEKKFNFYGVTNGKEAVRFVVQYYDKIDVIILDFKLSRLTGIEFLKQIVDRLGLEDLGIFIVTAFAKQKDIEAAMLRGVRGVIDKGKLDFDQFSELICEYLDLRNKEKAITRGIYVDTRRQSNQNYVFLRWKNSDGSWEKMYLGIAEQLETLTIPNLQTNLDSQDTVVGFPEFEDEIPEDSPDS